MKKGKAAEPEESLEVHGRDGDKIFDHTVQQTISG